MSSFFRRYEEVGEERAVEAVDDALKKYPEVSDATSSFGGVVSSLKLGANARLSQAQRTLANLSQDWGKNWPRSIQLYGHLASPVMDFGDKDFQKSLGELIEVRKAQELAKQAQDMQERAVEIEKKGGEYIDVAEYGSMSGVEPNSGAQFGKEAFAETADTPIARLALLNTAFARYQKPGYIVYSKDEETGKGVAEFEEMQDWEHDNYVKMPMSQLMSDMDIKSKASGGDAYMAYPGLIRMVFTDGMQRFQELAPKAMEADALASGMPSNLPSGKAVNPLASNAARNGVKGELKGVLEGAADLSSGANMAAMVEQLRPHLDSAFTPVSLSSKTSSVDNSASAQIARLRRGKPATVASSANAEEQASPEKPIGHAMYTTSVTGLASKSKPVVVTGNYMDELKARIGDAAAGKLHADLTASLRESHRNMGFQMDSAIRSGENTYVIGNKAKISPFFISEKSEIPVEAKAFSVAPNSKGEHAAHPYRSTMQVGYVTKNTSDGDLELFNPETGKPFTLKPKEYMISQAITFHGDGHDTVMITTPLEPVKVDGATRTWHSRVAVPDSKHTGHMVSGESYLSESGGSEAVHKFVNLVHMDK